MARPIVTGPALRVPEAAAYIGWAANTLRNEWRTRPLLVAAAVKDGRRLTFLRPGLDRYLRANMVAPRPANWAESPAPDVPPGRAARRAPT